jgi:DNA adenine methylase
LIPQVRKWIFQERKPVSDLVEPFAGGGIVSLTAAFEQLAQHITMVEKDSEIAAVWKVILNGKNHWLANKVVTYKLTKENIQKDLDNPDKQTQDVAFCTILRNRISHGGILAKGSGFIKNGEAGKGIASRWYPKTLQERILAVNSIKHKIDFIEGDAFDVLEQHKNNPNAYFFIDPPYTIAGRRLYNCHEIDHEKLFFLVSRIKGKYMLTYDHTEEILQLARRFSLPSRTIPMKTTHHLEKEELIISDNFSWWD